MSGQVMLQDFGSRESLLPAVPQVLLFLMEGCPMRSRWWERKSGNERETQQQRGILKTSFLSGNEAHTT